MSHKVLRPKTRIRSTISRSEPITHKSYSCPLAVLPTDGVFRPAQASGSDTPFNLMHVEAAAYRALLQGESELEAVDAVICGNIARLVGIEVWPPRRSQ